MGREPEGLRWSMGGRRRPARGTILAESSRSPEFHAVAGGGVRLERFRSGLVVIAEFRSDPVVCVLDVKTRLCRGPAEVGGASKHPGPPPAVGLSAHGFDGDSLQGCSMGLSEPPS